MLPILTDKSWISWIYGWYVPQNDWYTPINYHRHRGHLPYMVMWLCTKKKKLVTTGPVSPQNPGNQDQDQDQTTKDWLQPSTHIGCLWSSFSWVLGFLMVLGLDFQTLDIEFLREESEVLHLKVELAKLQSSGGSSSAWILDVQVHLPLLCIRGAC